MAIIDGGKEEFPENGKPIDGEAVFGPSKKLNSSKFNSVQKLVKSKMIESAPAGHIENTKFSL